MTVQLVEEDNTYAAAFRESMHRTDEPAWLRRSREQAFDRFEQLGFPKVTEEEWKYTNVAPIAKTAFAPALRTNVTASARHVALAPFAYEETQNSRLVFINGIFRSDLSATEALPAGLVAIDLKDALLDVREKAATRRCFERTAENDNGFVALNTALFAGGLFLEVPRGVVVKAPIHLLFVSESSNGGTPLAAFPRVLVHAEADSAATIIESYASQNESSYLTNAILDLVVDDGARISHYKVQRESTDAFHIALTRADLGRNAFYGSTSINFGAALSRHDIDVRMDHEGAECSVDGLYMVDGTQHTDTHSIIDHRQPHCTSHQLYKGILDGKSRAVFNGKVFVRHGAQQTDARQTNKNLLLSNDAQIDTKPQLEIYADDVKCTHGAAIGQIDEEETFYLESRGLNPALARNLLTYGFAEEVIERIKIESIKRDLDTAVLTRLGSQLETEAI